MKVIFISQALHNNCWILKLHIDLWLSYLLLIFQQFINISLVVIAFLSIFLVPLFVFFFFLKISLLFQWHFGRRSGKNFGSICQFLKSKVFLVFGNNGNWDFPTIESFLRQAGLNSEVLGAIWLRHALFISLSTLAMLPLSGVHFKGRRWYKLEMSWCISLSSWLNLRTMFCSYFKQVFI